jgi:hypothetical protein
MKTSQVALGFIVGGLDRNSRGGAKITAAEVKDAFAMFKANDGVISKDEFEAVKARASLYTVSNSTKGARDFVKRFLSDGFTPGDKTGDISAAKGFAAMLGKFDNSNSSGGKRVTADELAAMLKVAKDYPDADTRAAVAQVQATLQAKPKGSVAPEALQLLSDFLKAS